MTDEITERLNRIEKALIYLAVIQSEEDLVHVKSMLFPPKPRKIDWRKAMKNKAYDKNFLFSNNGVDWEESTLIGFDYEATEYPFLCLTDYYRHCKPVEGFEVPESWLEDE